MFMAWCLRIGISYVVHECKPPFSNYNNAVVLDFVNET
jgi:hypothetical protein